MSTTCTDSGSGMASATFFTSSPSSAGAGPNNGGDGNSGNGGNGNGGNGNGGNGNGGNGNGHEVAPVRVKRERSEPVPQVTPVERARTEPEPANVPPTANGTT